MPNNHLDQPVNDAIIQEQNAAKVVTEPQNGVVRMSLNLELALEIPVTLYNLEEFKLIERVAKHSRGQVYCWKTIGKSNWLEKGWSIADVVGMVVLPKGLPDVIDMPDDPYERSA
jgi:hypothetical protein